MAFFRMFQLSLEILQYQPLENPTGSAMRREKGAKSTVNMLHLNPPWYPTCNCEIPDFSQWRGGSGLIALMTRLTPSRLPEWVCNITLVSRLDQPLYSSSSHPPLFSPVLFSSTLNALKYLTRYGFRNCKRDYAQPTKLFLASCLAHTRLSRFFPLHVSFHDH